MNRLLGRNATQFEIDNWRDLNFPHVYNWKEKIIILPEEFFNTQGPESLYWKQLAEIRSKTGLNGSVLCRNIGVQAKSFDGLLEVLFEELVKKERMTAEDSKEGDYLVNGRGIEINYPEGLDFHGRRAFSSKFYYLRIKEDALSYSRAFKRGLITITQVVDKVIGESEY